MTAKSDFRHNHYVPEWYQRRFLPPGQGKYHYLDLKPETVKRNGHRFTRRDLQHWGPASCFAQDDLYTVKAGSFINTEIEQFFFGEIDRDGKAAVEYFAAFAHPDADDKAFYNLMTYMSVQKLRTPKGLGWLAQVARSQHRNLTLIHLQSLQNMFCAIWTECVWQIADTNRSPVKFIISDHPVTVYNRDCFPGSPYCTGYNDPDIRMVASHTYFPLSSEKILILTNLAWVRNPYQAERKSRPNPNFFRNAIFNYNDIQLYRSLSEQEVLEINYITKQRAFRYIAAAQKEWLYPEKRLTSTNWRRLGGGYLLMPEPREIHMGGQIYIGYKDGRHDAFSEYGHKPWEPGFENKERAREESRTLERFKAGFAVMQGPAWRGTSWQFRRKGPHVDSDEFHQHYVRKASQYRQRGKTHKAS
jgi:hypothetical protein